MIKLFLFQSTKTRNQMIIDRQILSAQKRRKTATHIKREEIAVGSFHQNIQNIFNFYPLRPRTKHKREAGADDTTRPAPPPTLSKHHHHHHHHQKREAISIRKQQNFTAKKRRQIIPESKK